MSHVLTTLRVQHWLKSSPSSAYHEFMMTTGSQTTTSDRADLTVSEIAADTGVAASAVRFYETRGVIDAVRTAGNQRRFHESTVCRIEVAKLAQRVGLTVREITELFSALPTDPGPADWEHIGNQLISEAERRVAELRTQLDSLGSGTELCQVDAAIDS